jgi:hypothetical protein
MGRIHRNKFGQHGITLEIQRQYLVGKYRIGSRVPKLTSVQTGASRAKGVTSNDTSAGNTPIHSPLPPSSYYTKTDRSSLDTLGSASLPRSSSIVCSSSSSLNDSIWRDSSDADSMLASRGVAKETQYGTYALPPTPRTPNSVYSSLPSPLTSPGYADTADTAAVASPGSTILSLSLAAVTRADLFRTRSPTDPLPSADKSSIPSRHSILSSCVYSASPPPVTHADNFYTEYSGLRSPSYANLAVTKGIGRDLDSLATGLSSPPYTGRPRNTPPPGPKYGSTFDYRSE